MICIGYLFLNKPFHLSPGEWAKPPPSGPGECGGS